ncbi:MAG: alanine:cation symporter family protein, partial [Anaerococcus sp.]|nr:alanine:cation symporter family protein [Anaerococcus sp.]
MTQENKEKMMEALADYNEEFATNFSLETIGAYNRNLNDRLARKKNKYKIRSEQVDIVIVVDRLLTGFDAPNLGLLFIDRPPMTPQGLIQALGVYLDTILICSATAFVIIISGEGIYLNPDLQGLEITQAALANEIGPWAQHFLTICVLMFAFSSIIGNYYYGENNIKAMDLGNKGLTVYRILVLMFVFLGSIGDFSIVWNTGDVFMGIMAVINLIILMIVGKCAVASYYDYKKQLNEGKDPVFNPRNIKELHPYLDEITAWDDPETNINNRI